MSRLLLIAHLAAVVLLAQGATGFHPRALPTDYAVNTQGGDVTFAASVVPPDQVRHLFPVDISNTYVVVEFAAYPKNSSVTLSPDDISLRGAKPDPVRSADAASVAAVIQEKNTPSRHSHSADGYVGAEIGHVSGTDPETGRPIHGTYTATEVGVEAGPHGPADDYPVPPGATPAGRDALERELQKQALPTGQFTVPTAGYLYFPASSLKKRSDGSYQLEYVSDNTNVKLDLPAKVKAVKP